MKASQADINKSLSDSEVLKVAGEGTRVFTYPQIAKMSNIEQLVNDRYPGAIILYQTETSPENNVFGHWVALKRLSPNKLCYFDSYGNDIDYPLHKIDVRYRIENNQLFRKLSHLIGNSQYNDISYNEHALQAKKPGVNTCGRWAGLFCNLGVDTDKFFELVKTAKQKLGYQTYDDLVVSLTNNFL